MTAVYRISEWQPLGNPDCVYVCTALDDGDAPDCRNPAWAIARQGSGEDDIYDGHATCAEHAGRKLLRALQALEEAA